MSATRSRDAMLERIRAAVPTNPADVSKQYATLVRGYCRKGTLSRDECVQLMIERLREYDAHVAECEPASLPATIAAQIARSGCRTLVAPAGLPREWMVPGPEWRIDHGLTHDQIEQVQGVVTAATCGVAESGTIVLHHSPAEGRRVLTLLPDWHLCVLQESQIIETLPEYFAASETPPPVATFISGPSATADIEMTRIKGVHGPRFLNVIVVRDPRRS